jgi:hypothetical protein
MKDAYIDLIINHKGVIPPGIQPKGFYDRILFDDAVKFAEDLGDDGIPLLTELTKMRKSGAGRGEALFAGKRNI